MCVQVTKTANRFEISSLLEKILCHLLSHAAVSYYGNCLTSSYLIRIYPSHYLIFELPLFVHILQEKLLIHFPTVLLLEVIDTENSDINHVLSKVNDIYIKAASNTMI
jgi:hypothetical protein